MSSFSIMAGEYWAFPRAPFVDLRLTQVEFGHRIHHEMDLGCAGTDCRKSGRSKSGVSWSMSTKRAAIHASTCAIHGRAS